MEINKSVQNTGLELNQERKIGENTGMQLRVRLIMERNIEENVGWIGVMGA